MLIRKAERKKAKLRLGISGLSGGGKTWSALEIAHGMGGKIGMIDTESGRGELYSGCKSKHDNNIHFEYDIIRLDAPFSPDRYIEALKAFEKAGYDVVIIDSLSHAWAGEGGVLSIVDKAGGQFQNGWKTGTPKQNALVDALIQCKMHLIANMRSKTEWVTELNEKGKHAPRKIGLAPIQRDQIEYEFTVFMSMNQENIAHITKDNSQTYNQQFIQPSPEMGRKLLEWLNTGADEREKFVNVTLPEIISEINHVANINELKEKFANYYKLYAENFSDEFHRIAEAKDAKKEELMESAMDNMAPPVSLAVVKSKYPQTLIGAVQ